MGKKQPKVPKNQTSTSVSEPWKGVQPYIKDYLQKAQTTASRPFNFYNGETIAGFSPEQQAGMNFATQRAMAGSPTQYAANQNITDTLNGKYLNADSNPYLKGMANQAYGDITSRINSQFNNNNFGSSANQELLTRGLTDAANSLYGGQYQAERNNQLQAANLAPSLAAADYNDANVLQQIGAQRQGLSQQYLDKAKGTFDQANNFENEQLDRYRQAVLGAQGSGGTTTNTGPGQPLPPGKSVGAGILGGATTGLGVMNGLAGITGGAVPSIAGLGIAGTAGLYGIGGALLGGLLG